MCSGRLSDADGIEDSTQLVRIHARTTVPATASRSSTKASAGSKRMPTSTSTVAVKNEYGRIIRPAEKKQHYIFMGFESSFDHHLARTMYLLRKSDFLG
ncbi:unnamed protein product [Calypogeia fissa]